MRNQILFSSLLFLSFFLSKRSRALNGEGKNLHHSNSARSHCVKLQGVSAKFFFLFFFFFFFFSILLQFTLNHTTASKELGFQYKLIMLIRMFVFHRFSCISPQIKILQNFFPFSDFIKLTVQALDFNLNKKGFVHICSLFCFFSNCRVSRNVHHFYSCLFFHVPYPTAPLLPPPPPPPPPCRVHAVS